MSKTVQIESDSKPGEFYSVDIRSLTCTCPYFAKKLADLPLEDPHRLCKHLTQALWKTGIPSFLERYSEDIEWFGKHGAAFSDKNSIKTNKTRALPKEEVQTTSVTKKRKYCHVRALARDKKITAVIPLDGGLVSYTINNSHAQYNTVTQESFVPPSYRNLEQGLVSWIVEEYNKVKNDSAPTAIKPKIDFNPIQTESPEGSVRTVSIDRKTGPVELRNVIDSFEEVEHFHLRGQVGRESIEAVIRKSHPTILYSINGSRAYTYDLSPTKEESAVKTSAGEFRITFSADLSDEFPRAYWFIEKAVLRWFKEEYSRIVTS